MTADEIEAKIDEAFLRLQTAVTPEARRVAWASVKYWKEQRAPEVVRKIEEEKGLC